MSDENIVPTLEEQVVAVIKKPRKAPTKKKSKSIKKRPKKAAAVDENGATKPKKPKRHELPVTRWTVPDERKIVITKKGEVNPKSPMSPSWKRYELYKIAETVGGYRKFMRQGKAGGKSHFANLDLARDRERGYIKF
jgi:hypothetical protein